MKLIFLGVFGLFCAFFSENTFWVDDLLKMCGKKKIMHKNGILNKKPSKICLNLVIITFWDSTFLRKTAP